MQASKITCATFGMWTS